jgi:hypothetical protein
MSDLESLVRLEIVAEVAEGTQREEGFTIDDFGFLNEGEWIG